MPNNKTKPLENTGERMIPEFHDGSLIYAEHLTRYMAAESIVDGKVVLDIASGSGYGTNLLAKKAKKVYGVDVSADAVAYSKTKFSAPNVEFLVGDGTSIPLPDNCIDVVVTFETIEHIEDFRQFLKEVKRVLKPDGMAIVSTPNDIEFAEGNHFHVHQFTHKELIDELRGTFRELKEYYQSTWKYVGIDTADAMSQKGEIKTKLLNTAPLKTQQCLYFYVLCSNRKITEKIEPLAAIGEHYSDRQLIGELTSNAKTIHQQNQALAKTRQEVEQLKDALKNTQKELQNITGSKRYMLASKMALPLRPVAQHRKKRHNSNKV